MPHKPDTHHHTPTHTRVGRFHWRGFFPVLIAERMLDSIPGCLVVIALVVSIIGSVFVPVLMLYLSGVMALYLSLRYLAAGLANLQGMTHIAQAESTDWHTTYQQQKSDSSLSWDEIKHVVIIPNYNESLQLLSDTLMRLAQVNLAQEKLVILLAMEAAESGSIHKAQRLQAEFAHYFHAFHFTVHPTGLPGEIQCKSANLAWAGRWIKRELVDKSGWQIDHLTITAMDADTAWHPHYFEALTCAFALDAERYSRFWQAPIRYHGNIYQIHPVVRPINAYATAVELAYLSAPWWESLPISSYSLSLRLLEVADYWDVDVIADEWHMYIKAFFARSGALQMSPLYLPFLATATGGKNLWQTVKNRYRQSLRHAWGSKEVGYTLSKLMDHTHMPNTHGLRLLLSVAHDVLMDGAGWIMITVGSQLPVLLHTDLREAFFDRGVIYPRTLMLEISVVIMALLGLMFLIVDKRTRPPRSTPPTFRDRILGLLGVPLLPIFALLFVILPVLHAQMMLLLGKSLPFKVTEKE